MFKISVIVPVYNAGFYLRDTLDSLLNQTMFEDIEVILVDDGSIDNSKYIIEDYASDYENFFAYHKNNDGVTFTRNYGIDLARGEYIAFLDADDHVPPTAYEILYDLAKKYGHDIVTGNFLRFNTSQIWNDPLSDFVFGDLDENIESTNLYEYDNLTWDSLVWNKIYKKEFLERYDIRFPYERILFEDNIFTIKAYVHAKSVGVLNKNSPVYYWRSREDNSSISQEITVKHFNDRIRIMHMVNDVMIKNIGDINIINKKYRKWLIHDLMNVYHVKMFPMEYREELLNEVVDVLKLGPERVIDSLEPFKADIYKKLLKKDFSDYLIDENNEGVSSTLQKDKDNCAVIFEDHCLKFILNSDDDLSEKIEKDSYCALLKNRISSKEIKYELIYGEDRFSIIIPYLDLLKEPIKKWVLTVDFKLKPGEYGFIYNENIINVNLKEDLVFIDLDYFDSSKSLTYSNLLLSKNKKLEKDLELLSKENKSLRNKNNKLNVRVNQYKSRKIVKLTDKIRKFF